MADFPFNVGDKIRRFDWADGTYLTITAIGKEWLLGVHSGDAEEDMWNMSDESWEPYALPKRYVVELRAPRMGEQWIDARGNVITVVGPDHPTNESRIVIVEELS